MITSPLPAVIPTPTFNLPTPSVAALYVSTDVLLTLLSRDEPECANISLYRTTRNIVLSCLTTIFACTWVALHLDVPESHKSPWKSLWRRVREMLYALIVPEAVPSRALHEWFAAKKYMDEWNKNYEPLCSPEIVVLEGKSDTQDVREAEEQTCQSRWTLMHGFLAAMGGIRLYEGRDQLQIFRPDSKLFENPKMWPVVQQIGLISRHDIADKSKRDWLSKTFAIIQTTWFVIQCLTRWATHLPVTQLEVVTLGYAVLNIFSYILWWHKPQNLYVPFRLYLEKDGEKPVSGRLVVNGARRVEEGLPMLTRSPEPNSVNCGRVRLSKSHTLQAWAQLVSRPSEKSGTRDSSIPLFRLLAPSLFFVLFGSIFGALHLIPLWLSGFPSYKEREMWKVAAIYVTVTPLSNLIIASIAGLLIYLVLYSYCSPAEVATVGRYCFIVPYAVARVILLVLTFTTLRSLPKEAFHNVEWTRFIPHF